MRDLFVFSKEQHLMAIRLEEALISLPKESGILFAGAMVIETLDGCMGTTWGITVNVGYSRNLVPGVVDALVWSVIANDPELVAIRSKVKVFSYRGVARSS